MAKVTLETTDLAINADGAILAKMGNTVVLVTAVLGEKKEISYVPLKVTYTERYYAAGEILGSRYTRREYKPSDEATLSGRVIDRTLRPLFPTNIGRDIDVTATVLALGDYDPDIPAIIGASAALHISKTPWNGPIGAVRVVKTQAGELVANPSYAERKNALYDFVFCGKNGEINMIDGSAYEMSEAELKEVMDFATKQFAEIEKEQEELRKKYGVEKVILEEKESSATLEDIYKKHQADFEEAFADTGKKPLMQVAQEFVSEAKKQGEDPIKADTFLEHKKKEFVRAKLQSGTRLDGRKANEVRELYAKAGGISPVLHGTGTFFRGNTRILSTTTLGSPRDAQVLDSIEHSNEEKYFIHHYNFPSFSTGEAGGRNYVSRREIGHGALVEKAVKKVLPKESEFPYTIRVVSEALSSDGSTSMGSVSATSISLMDAGVPIKAPVVGVAMGLVEKSILTDIRGVEDASGDMDFKLAGTENGITAIQLDVKVDSIPVDTLLEAAAQARAAHQTILATIKKEIGAPRPEISEYAPKIISLSVQKKYIGKIIGAGGSNIEKIKQKTGIENIDIEEDGTVLISGHGDSTELAKKEIEAITHEYAVGESAGGIVKRVEDYGVFVELPGGKTGLLRKDELKDAAPALGDKLNVTIKEIDQRKRLNLALK